MEIKMCPFIKEACRADCALRVDNGCEFSAIACNVGCVEDQLEVFKLTVEDQLQEVTTALRNLA